MCTSWFGSIHALVLAGQERERLFPLGSIQAEMRCIETVSANQDQWIQSLADGDIFSCDLNATSSGVMSCFDAVPTTAPDGAIISTIETFGTDIITLHVVLEGSTSPNAPTQPHTQPRKNSVVRALFPHSQHYRTWTNKQHQLVGSYNRCIPWRGINTHSVAQCHLLET
jgi:hypothetical protein